MRNGTLEISLHMTFTSKMQINSCDKIASFDWIAPAFQAKIISDVVDSQKYFVLLENLLADSNVKNCEFV